MQQLESQVVLLNDQANNMQIVNGQNRETAMELA